MEKDFLACPWDNISKHVIRNKVKDKPIFKLEGDGGVGDSNCKQMRFDMRQGSCQRVPWVLCFPVLLMTDSAAWKQTPGKIRMKMVRL